MNLRNTVLLCSILACGTAWAVDPLVGPGKVGEKDQKGHVKGANAGAGPHRSFTEQYERRGGSPEEEVAKDKKQKREKAQKEAKDASKPH